jgi:hypothetical protein
MTLVIDYGLLASLPVNPGTAPSGQGAPDASPIATGQNTAPVPPAQTIQPPAQPSAREWEDMRRELQDLKRKLAEQEAERNAEKQNVPSKQAPTAVP